MQQGARDDHSASQYSHQLAAFAHELTALRIAQGKPSLQDVERYAPPGRPLSKSAVSEALNGRRLPGLDFLIALVQTLLKLGDPRRLDVPRSDPRLEVWRSRWQQLQLLQAEDRRLPGAAAPGSDAGEQTAPADSPPPPDGRTLRLFVAMPGSTMGQAASWKSIPEIHRRLLRPVADMIGERLGRELELVIEKDKSATGFIHRSMFAEALEADVYIADLTGANPNVYLELGVRWAVSDGVTIPICQDRAEVRFNVIANRVIEYGPMPDALQEAVERISRAAVDGLRGRRRVDSPVRDGSPLILISRTRHEEAIRELARLREQQAHDLIEGALRTADPRRRVELLERAIEENPVSWRAYFELGATLRGEGRYREAERALRTAVELKPDLAAAWREIGIALGKSGASDDGAVEAFDRALALDDKDSETWATQGGLLRRLSRKHVSGGIDTALLERSLSCYRKASELAPNQLYPLMNTARIELLLAGLTGRDPRPSLSDIRNLEHLARFAVSGGGALDPWAHFDLADVLVLTGRGGEGLAELHAAAALVPEGERAAALESVAEPLRDFLAVAGTLEPATVDSIRRALDTCDALSRPSRAPGTPAAATG